MAIRRKMAIILWYHAQVLFAAITTVAIVDGKNQKMTELWSICRNHGRDLMKHEREWHTCDRCGKEMTFYNEKYARLKTEELEPIYEKTVYTAEDLAE